MKISEITATDVADFLRIEDYTAATLQAIMSTAKQYIMSYTGLCDEIVAGEELEAISGTEFSTQYAPIVSDTLTVYVDGVETTEFEVDYTTGVIVFDEEPTAPTADYTAGIDSFPDFYVAYMVLCQDMYDTRTMYVENTNVNKVVEAVLSMHCTNLL